MKTNEIIKCLKANKNISAYELVTNEKDSRELFYVLKHLEINRAVKVLNTAITIYVNTKDKTGSSVVTVTAQDNAKTLAKKINAAIKKAKAAKNAYYPIVSKQKNIKEKEQPKDLSEIATNVAKAVLKADVYKDGWLNSTEIFVSSYKKNFINSNGVNHTTYSFKIEVECIPTWSNNKEEFELYKFYESNKIDYKQITKEVNEIMVLAKERSIAKTPKEIKLPKNLLIMVKNDMRDTIVSNITSDLSYRELFMKQNHYKKKDVVSNNKFDLEMKANIDGCSESSKIDGNGVVLKNKKIIEKGVVKANFGGIRFGYYTKQKSITGSLPVCELTAKGANYKNQKHLIIETFSSPQLEATSGYWGGEVRLARYFDGKKYIPLTGFSISGSIYEDLKNVEFSKELDVSPNYKGPKYFMFKTVKIH